MKTNQYITDYYNSHDEGNRLSPKHRTVEFLTTMYYIEKYIKPGSHVLEIGAGTGRYSYALARQEYMVDAVELVPRNIEAFHRCMLPTEHITITQGSALNLSAFPGNRYDITLLLGSLYHLYSKEEKRQTSDETVRATKQGDIILTAYVISSGCLLDGGFDRGNINAAEYIKNGLLDPRAFATRSKPKGLFGLVCEEDIGGLMSVFPTTRLHYAATDDCALLIREAVDKIDDKAFGLYLKYHYATYKRENLTSITSHAIDVFQK